MSRLQLGGWVAALGLLAGVARADEPKKDPDPARALIDKLVDVTDPDTGYSGSHSGTSFLPLGRREVGTFIYGQRSGAPSDTVRSLVKLGAKAVPALLDHLGDDRRTKIVVEHGFGIGGLFVTQDKGEMVEEKVGEGFGTQYTARVGDLCYVALGQLVNREYTAVRYQPTAIIRVTCVPKSKELRENLKKEWGGMTAGSHRDSLAKDLYSDREGTRDGASVRLAYYYPEAFELLALEQLARPTYDWYAAIDLLGKLDPAKSAKDRKALVDAFVEKHGEIARDGLVWLLFGFLEIQEAEERKQYGPTRNPENKARQCLTEVFGLPAAVASADRPKTGPIAATAKTRFVRTLRYDRGEKLDRALRDLLAKTDDEYLAAGCMDRLAGRGYDADIEAYLTRRQLKLSGREQEAYRAKLGWTRLHAAVELGVPELIAAALKEARDVNARDRDGRTALHLAATDGHAGAVEQLLGAKADPNVKDRQGRPAVQLAAFADHPDVVRRLAAAKSEVPDVFTAVLVGDAARLGELLKGEGERAKGRNGRGHTALHVAVREGHEASVRGLLTAGAEVNAIDIPPKGAWPHPCKWTPLHVAVFANRANVARLLLGKGADVDAADDWGLTPLHYAATNGEVELVKVLLSSRATRGAKDKRGRTPLDLAKEGKHAAVVELLEVPK